MPSMNFRRSFLAAVLSLFLAQDVMNAQSDSARPEFDAASIKKADSDPRGAIFRSYPNKLVGTKIVPKLLIQHAYDIMPVQILNGPAWLDSERYDIDARTEHETTEKQSMRMLQTLLEDRFKLQAHREKREGAQLSLTVANGGIKLGPFKKDGCTVRSANTPISSDPSSLPICGMLRPGVHGMNQTWDSIGLSTTTLAATLTLMLGKLVVDKTGIVEPLGVFHMEFGPPRLTQAAEAPPEGFGPSIHTALQEQLGLKLVSTQDMIDVLIIDHVERPDAN